MKLRKILLKIVAPLFAIVVLAAMPQRANGLSLDLDSIATWGKFPRFCVNTYRWGDKFFNTYDSAYVQGTGYKFNIKVKSDTWVDNYIFELPDGYRMNMVSDFCTSAGAWVTYLALSAGYDINVSKYIGGATTSRKKWNFRFNCALLSADFYWITNDVGTRITSFGERGDLQKYDLRFTGINTSIFGVDAFYHFNNKRYSRAAAFNYSKIQQRSQGSFFLGLSYWSQDFTFDFQELPPEIKYQLPPEWIESGYIYHSTSKNYSLRLGYGYNWVFHPHWLLGVSESPILGLKRGVFNYGETKYTASLYNRFQFSLIWNNRAWFAGLVGSAETGIFIDKKTSLFSNVLTFEASVGYRFNLW